MIAPVIVVLHEARLQGSLITPHGDWKLESGRGGVHPATGSLPLMGIGNVAGEKAFDRRNCISLPLMGIGNGPSSRHRLGRHQLLITPHGDWKPVNASTTTKTTNNSLPLMGIGNNRCFAA